MSTNELPKILAAVSGGEPVPSAILAAVIEVIGEYRRARVKHAFMKSRHEGYAILLEEVDELWDEIKHDCPTAVVRKEAVQVAAMALAFLAEVCE